MLKKIKYISILSIAAIYILHVCFSFSGILIENIQQVRYENQVSKNFMKLQKEFSFTDWQLLDNKKEIEINNVFYDVISVEKVGQRVMVKVVKDSFESEFRVLFQNVFNKKDTANSSKKKIFKPYSLKVVLNEVKTNSISVLTHYFYKPNFPFLNIKTAKIIKAIHRPPC